MTSLRQPMFCLAALAVYLAVNIGAGTFHHHGLEATSGQTSSDHNSTLQLQAASSADHDGDDDSCLFCRVLHLARVLPIVVRVEAVTAYTAQTIPAVAIARAHFLATTTHSRAPPFTGQ
jgi:Protein of unknown function (DUF2946)